MLPSLWYIFDTNKTSKLISRVYGITTPMHVRNFVRTFFDSVVKLLHPAINEGWIHVRYARPNANKLQMSLLECVDSGLDIQCGSHCPRFALVFDCVKASSYTLHGQRHLRKQVNLGLDHTGARGQGSGSTTAIFP